MTNKSKTIEQELLPCPWCGTNEVNIVEMPLEGTNKVDYYVCCVKPGCDVCPTTRWWNSSTRAEAIKAWNTRKPPVIEAGEGVKWPEKPEEVRLMSAGQNYNQGYRRGYSIGARTMHDAFTTILKQKGLL